MSALSYLLSREALTVKVPPVPSSFAGTFLVEGEGAATVTAIGADTRLAQIALLTRAGERPTSPLAVELRRVVRTVAVIAVGVGIGFFLLALLIGTPAQDGSSFPPQRVFTTRRSRTDLMRKP